MDVEDAGDVASIDSSGHNIGELIAGGADVTTREVLALVHEVCRDAAAVFPRSPGDLWITHTGELLIARSDQISEPVDPRNGVAALLEAMLPPEGAAGADREVPAALRGLPARLRATTEGMGPQDRRDLMSILSFHLGGDPRDVIRQLAQRVATPAAAAAAGDIVPDFDLDAFPDAPPPAEHAPEPQRERRFTAVALAGLAVLFLALGSASYWVFGRDANDINQDLVSTPEAAVEEPRVVNAPEPARADSRVAVAPPSSPVVPAPPQAAPATPPTERSVAAAPPPAAVAERVPRPLRLDVREGAFSPTFASTGELFFHSGRSNNGRLLVASLDRSGEVSRISALRDDGARDYHPRVSPDGKWIAFDSDRDGERGVYIARRDGAKLQRVSGDGYAAVPSWSPDMKRLAFIRGERARPRVWNLWTRDLATGELHRQTSFKSGQVWGASWFPDGRTICFSHDDELIITRLGSGEQIVIDTPKRGRLVRTPAVSPDGKSVVFQVFRDGVWLLDVETRAMRRILADPTAEEFAWSPDGERIAYHSRRDGAWKIWVMPV
jgi:hypothetical protein